MVVIFILFCCFFNNFFLLKDGWTALHIAAGNGFEQIVKILIEHGSNVNLQTKVFIFLFFSFFFFFCCYDSLLVVSCCCEWLGCVIFDLFYLFFNNFFLLKYGWTALHSAAEKGFEQIVKILIEHGSNVNLQEASVFFFFFF